MANSRIIYLVYSSALILSVICNETESSEGEEKIEKILRVQLEENGKKIVTMSDGEMFVNFELTEIGAIGDCKVVRRRRMALGMLKYDSEAFTGEGEVTFYDADDLDIQWYGRQCSRFQRNITLPGEEEKYSDVLGRQKLNKEYPGTKYCTRFGATYNAKLIDGSNPEDECCKILKGCDNYLPYMHYRHSFLNVNLYDMSNCQCMEGFRNCLKGLDTELSKELQHLFFDLLNVKCYDLESGIMCQKYSKWFDSCENYVTYLTIKPRRLP